MRAERLTEHAIRCRRMGGLWLLATVLLTGAGANAGEKYRADWESLKQHEAAPKWFRDAKFGIYFHWGVYSVPAFGSEWYPRNMHIRTRPEYKHHVATYGDPATFGYHDFVPLFTAEHFDPDEWAELFAKAGARFAGPVAEHHDGFSMWDSDLTPWNAMDRGPKRDITGELAKALRQRHIRLVTTFHHARNQGHYPRVEGWPTTSDDPELQMLYGNMPRDRFLKLWKGKLIEVIDKYHPDLMWFDSWLNEIPDKERTEYLAYYFNRAAEWGRDVVVTYKQRDLPSEIGVEDFEKGRASRLTEHTWLTDDTISRGSWCYTRNLTIKPASEVIHVLVDIVSKNGQLLLNISPKADGTIPQNQREVLLAVGAWLDRCGDAIYETRPWVTFGEGPTRLSKGGAFVRMKGGYTAKDIRFTTRGDTLYAVFLGEPQGTATVASLATGAELCGGQVGKVTLLGNDASLPFAQDAAGLHITFPKQLPTKHAVAVRLDGLQIIGFTPDTSIRFANGKATLSADKATLHGPGIKTEDRDQGHANIGFWDDANAWAEWQVSIPSAGKYAVRGRIAALAAGAFTLRCGEATLAANGPVTGDWEKFKTVDLGTIDAAAGKQVLRMTPASPASWAPLNLAWLELRPVR